MILNNHIPKLLIIVATLPLIAFRRSLFHIGNKEGKNDQKQKTNRLASGKFFLQDWDRKEWLSNKDEKEAKNETIEDLWFNLECDALFSRVGTPRPIPTRSDYNKAIELYNSLMAREWEGMNETEKEHTLQSPNVESNLQTFKIRYEVRNDPRKGRGLFAMEDVPKHSVMKTTSCGWFDDADQYRKFILGLEQEFACDVLQWAFPYRDPHDQLGIVVVDLDEASMLNDGGYQNSNLGCPTHAHDLEGTDHDDGFDCDSYEYALHDIQAGEEILMNYDNFFDFDAYDELGLSK